MSDIAYARPSSTVVLVREGTGDPELFMVRRHGDATFGDAFAFPGGVVDSGDTAVHEYCTGLSMLEADAHLGVKENGLDYYVAGIRELFEETGVLLANSEGIGVDLCEVRDALNDGGEDWSDFVVRHQLELHCDELHYFAHWITPQVMKDRYSTRFFLACIPNGQEASHCGGELVDSRWTTAHDMLDTQRAGEVEMIFPTIKTLEIISRYKTLESLVEWARSCVEWGVTTMLPAVITRDGEMDIVLPGDRDYPGPAI